MKLKSLRYLVTPRPFALEKPIVLQFPVIDICNSRCQMCKIWENRKSDDITPEDLRRGLSNPLYSEVMSVGLNGGEPTLRKDLAALTEVLFETLPRLRNIALITNAFKHQEVIARIGEVGEVVRAHGGHLDVMVSLDGVGAVHDRVRGKPGNFARAQHVIDFLQSSDLVGTLRIGCTIIRENVYGLADLFEYCQSRDLYIKYRLGVPHQRLYTRDLRDPYALSAEERYHVVEFLHGLNAHYETNANQRFFYASLIGQLAHGAPRRAGCDWQHRGATITSKGELLYCAVESEVLGDIRNGDSEAVYFGNAPHLREILATKCAGCHHDYVGLPERGEHRRQVVERLLAKGGTKEALRTIEQATGARELRHARAYRARRDRLTAIAPAAPVPRDGRHRVMIGGWYGTETLGDKAILAGVVQGIEATLGSCDVTLVSLHPYVSEMTRAQMPELEGCTIVTPEEAAARVDEMDLVVFGGGPMMAIRELAEMEALFARAAARDVPTLVAGCGVGPLGAPHLDAAIARILSAATWRIYRDAPSRAAAARLGVDVRADRVAEDPAFTWLDGQRAARAQTPEGAAPVLVLGLRDFPFESYARHLDAGAARAAKARFERVVRGALGRLVAERPELRLRPLPMCTNHFGDDDRWFYRRLFRGDAGLAPHLDLSLLGPELAPAAYVDAFGSARAALTMRFHAEVFALALGLPTVAIDYTLGRGKVAALSEAHGVPHQPLDALDEDRLVDMLRAALDGGLPLRAVGAPTFTAVLGEVLGPHPLARAATR